MAQTRQDMGSGNVKKLLLQLMIPAIVAQVVNLLYNIVDRIYIGHIAGIGAAALTGVGLFAPILMLLNAFAMLIGAGGAPRTAIALGQGNKDEAEKIIGNSFTMLLFFAVVLTIGFYAGAPLLLRLFGASEATLPYALAYSRIYILGSVCVLLVMGMNPFITTQGFAKISMLTTVIGAVINIILDPIFIFGFGMGTGGAGVATALSQSIGFCILLSMFLRGRTVSQFRITKVTRSARDFGQIFFNGAPSFGRQGLNSIGGMLLNIAAREYGDAAVAGMSIISRIFMFILSVAIGVGQGLQPVAAFNYGAKKYRRVRQAAIFTIFAAFCFVCVLNVVCWCNSETLIHLFRDDPEVLAVALPAFRYQCLAMFLQPVIVVANMMFQSIGKSGRATFLACCRQGVCFIPLILTLPHLLGLPGIEMCQPIADMLTFFISVPFLLPFLHKLNRMEEA